MPAKRSTARSLTVLGVLGICALLLLPTAAGAQNTAPASSETARPSPPDSRESEMGSKPHPATQAVHEGSEKKARGGTTKGKHAIDKKRNTKGAGGFDNGLYGTGAGSAK
jgi:hypothetical protein